MLSKLIVMFMLAAPMVPPQGGAASGSGAPPQIGDPTPFEQIVDKLKIDSKQLPEIQKIFTAGATEAIPVSQEMITARQKLVELGPAGKAEDAAAAVSAYTAAATKMTGIEVRAFQKVLELLKPNQKSKAAEAFVIMAGIFNPPTPRTGSVGRRGRGGE